MENNALNYEYLIRKAHQCKRYGADGASAGIFRNLENAASNYSSKSEENLEKANLLREDFMYNMGKVHAYILTAIGVAMENPTLNADDVSALDTLGADLKRTMDETIKVINSVNKVLDSAGLKPL